MARGSVICMILTLIAVAPRITSAQQRIQSADYVKLQSVGDVSFSPDGTRLAYTVQHNDAPGRPYSQLWILDAASGRSMRVGDEQGRGSSPVWSPDGRSLAFIGRIGSSAGLMVARNDGSSPVHLADVEGTNSSALTNTGSTIAWSPDGTRIAFVHATPGPETKDATGDPIVITRFLYKPTLTEGNTRFNDNRRLHIFVVTVASHAIKQLTDGVNDEHSIDWSPSGEEILFVSNREPDADQFFNNDIFAVKVTDGSIRRITATENNEYHPKWSADGRTILYQANKRGLTDLETNMEDTHAWLMNADGSNRREIGKAIDNRQGEPEWSPDGRSVYVTVQEHGNVRLYRLPADGGAGQPVVSDRGNVGAFAVAKGDARSDRIAYVFTSPKDLGELYLKDGSTTKALTDVNHDVLAGKPIADVEAFTFVSNDYKYEVEAFLTKPIGMTATSKHPLVVNIHGGPHGQQGPAFNVQNQVYAARGWATLMVNYRGSTGYGQAWADAIFRDQNGDEAFDVLNGVNAAIRRNPWIDRDRLGIEGGSYGGQLTAWIITQTNMFKAAIPNRSIINLVSYNYTTYYNQYEQMEFGVRPHQQDLMDELWKRSSLRYAAQVHTPTMIVHGENDNDVPIGESEQFYIALQDVGVETVLVRYPREGHGLREPKHIVDLMDRSIAWYERHF
ncbi:MAG TPA: S9 family peptidase [Vicinamibacterales bacterium]